MNPASFNNLDPKNAAIAMGCNVARELLAKLRDDRGAMGIDGAGELVGAAATQLIEEAAQNGYSTDSLVPLESFAMELGEAIYLLMYHGA